MTERMRSLREKKEAGRPIFSGFITGGFPSIKHTPTLLQALERGGCDVIELGVPFSDPIADGPVIARVSHEAVRRGTTLKMLLTAVKRARRSVSVPIVLMGYGHSFYHAGYAETAAAAYKAGVDGVLAVDLPYEERREIEPHFHEQGLDCIRLLSPVSDQKRTRAIAGTADGFLYLVAYTGITGSGAKAETTPIKRLVKVVRQETDIPALIGFGIRTPEQARERAALADGIVMGSALMEEIERHQERSDCAERTAAFLRPFRRALGT